MHFSAPLVLASIFSLSVALPAPQEPAPVAPGRLPVSYDFQLNTVTFKEYASGGSGKGSGKGSTTPVAASTPFTIKAYNSESPIHMMDITASYNRFWVGNSTNSTCTQLLPGVPSPDPCVTGNATALYTTATGKAKLDVQLPQGQFIYIDAQGALRFNSTGEPIPRDARTAIFALSQNPIPPPPGVSAFVFSGVGLATGYLACPVARGGPYQVFANLGSVEDADVPSGDKSDCIGIDALATNYQTPVPPGYRGPIPLPAAVQYN